MRLKYSLKNKLFMAIIFVLIFNIFLSLILGTTFFDKLYTFDKIDSLKKGVDEIKTSYLKNNLDDIVNTIINHEIQNMSICIFSLDVNTGEGELEYYSRQKYFSANPFEKDVLYLIEKLYNENTFNKLNDKNKYYIINDEENHIGNNITVVSNINENKYIIVQTPKKFIRDISNLAVKYGLYISIFTFLIGAIIIYFIADRTTKPIREMQKTANNISNLDFSYRCDVLSNDEVGLLSVSINNMAVKLQDYVSQLMIANEKLKDDLTRQEKTDQMRKQFIANVSHDFKTPLTLIMSYSEALLDMKDMDETTKIEYLNIIVNEGNKMSEFVQELLKLSQLESGMIKLEKTNFSINEIINDTIRKNKIISKSKNLTINKDISNNSIVFADYYRITQVVQNLYENAIKYAPTNGEVKISTSIKLNKCIVRIYNTGKPISNEDLENIFISFYRSDKSRKNMGSYGLGLAIVKVIMDMHNENFGVQNIDNGVEFWFELENIEIDTDMEE
ncbi:signal transduction histidine kinase [Sedimentibacter acidaminivorans]|uniref:histidine kinase n=1 Tax=Sedimentibacter acidaminivorans TaxID=913099 RepID=A0ABS4GG33_9FIRM|nr:HAMP domain-containing sensor histidine kinase [Sedimentibacter acidaminivorans]MBP1926340.1 signal transduction histidine kinase [Sedimentibacter acidaminivorans]